MKKFFESTTGKLVTTAIVVVVAVAAYDRLISPGIDKIAGQA